LCRGLIGTGNRRGAERESDSTLKTIIHHTSALPIGIENAIKIIELVDIIALEEHQWRAEVV